MPSRQPAGRQRYSLFSSLSARVKEAAFESALVAGCRHVLRMRPVKEVTDEFKLRQGDQDLCKHV
jgi:hypothetical protein